MASRPHAPRTSISSHRRTCDAVANIGSSRSRAATAHWNSTTDHALGGETAEHGDARRVVELAAERDAGERRRRPQDVGDERRALSREAQSPVAEVEGVLAVRRRSGVEPQQRPGGYGDGLSTSIATGRRGRSRVCGWRRQTSAATA